MTASLADFIASPEGAMYGAYCRAYDEHPGNIFSDDVIRFQVGLAYMLRDKFVPEETKPEDDGFLSEDFWRTNQDGVA